MRTTKALLTPERKRTSLLSGDVIVVEEEGCAAEGEFCDVITVLRDGNRLVWQFLRFVSDKMEELYEQDSYDINRRDVACPEFGDFSDELVTNMITVCGHNYRKAKINDHRTEYVIVPVT